MTSSNVFAAKSPGNFDLSQADVIALAASDPAKYLAFKAEAKEYVDSLNGVLESLRTEGAAAQRAIDAMAAEKATLASDQDRLVAGMVKLTEDQATLAALQATLNEANAQLNVDKEQFQALVGQLGNDRTAFENEKMAHAANAQNALAQIEVRQTELNNQAADLGRREATLNLKVTAWQANKEQFINQLREWSI